MRLQVTLFLTFLLCAGFVYSRNATCNSAVDKYAANHTFFAGYLNPGFNDTVTGLGFVFYSKKNAFTAEQIAAVPTLVWLNGGPGSSSMEGAYFENGPYRVLNVNGSMAIETNPDAWTNKYNVLFIDQPIAVGFSRSDKDSYLPHNETVVGQQFYKALLSFYTGSGCYNNPIFLNSPLFITGESYGGKYIPNIAAEIIKANKVAAAAGNLVLPLKGVSIGDPLIDPQHQLYQLGEYGVANGLISDKTRVLLQVILNKMHTYFNANDYQKASNTYDEAVSFFMKNTINKLQNVYNYKIGPYPDDFVAQHCENYIKQFGFDKNFTYDSTNGKISNSLSLDCFTPNGIPALQYILASGLPVIIYNGDNDILINTPGVITFINGFEWAGQQVFANLPMLNVTNNNQTVATYKAHQNLHFATILDAGHLVPFDQPESMNLILDNFIDSVLEQSSKPVKANA